VQRMSQNSWIGLADALRIFELIAAQGARY
jgi:hypothetical protein